MAKRWALAIFVVFLAVLILTLLCCAGLKYLFKPRERSVSLEYIVNINPKEGEIPKDVALYLPFPYYEGKPIEKVFAAMEHEFNEFVRDNYPEATIKLVSTKYGKMVKIEIQELRMGISFGADPLDPQYGPCFRESASLSPPSTRYLLKPRFEVATNKEGDQVSHTWIYLNYREAAGIVLRSQYTVKHRSQSRIGGFFGWHPSGGDFFAFIGSEKLPDWREQPFTIPVAVEINKKGWVKIPVAEAGYGSR
ncbi:MAG: hypothetical protein QMD08_08240 [Actinomycetota bacterium]|nr:hypothetical protein [Actinomycetota bacterium]